jgi:hypothetical protein
MHSDTVHLDHLPVTTEPDGPGTMLQTVTIPVQEVRCVERIDHMAG